jgi:hypothetical protein
MSERYGACRSCLGSGSKNNTWCGLCQGTGWSGDIMDYLNPHYALRFPWMMKEKKRSPEDALALAIESMKKKKE